MQYFFKLSRIWSFFRSRSKFINVLDRFASETESFVIFTRLDSVNTVGSNSKVNLALSQIEKFPPIPFLAKIVSMQFSALCSELTNFSDITSKDTIHLGVSYLRNETFATDFQSKDRISLANFEIFLTFLVKIVPMQFSEPRSELEGFSNRSLNQLDSIPRDQTSAYNFKLGDKSRSLVAVGIYVSRLVRVKCYRCFANFLAIGETIWLEFSIETRSKVYR